MTAGVEILMPTASAEHEVIAVDLDPTRLLDAPKVGRTAAHGHRRWERRDADDAGAEKLRRSEEQAGLADARWPGARAVRKDQAKRAREHGARDAVGQAEEKRRWIGVVGGSGRVAIVQHVAKRWSGVGVGGEGAPGRHGGTVEGCSAEQRRGRGRGPP